MTGRQRAGPAALWLLWRNRVPLAGLTALALALVGEQLLRRTGDTPAPNAPLGTALLQVAALLVGLVAWVWPGRRGAPVAPAEDGRAALAASTLPVRRGGRGAVRVEGAPGEAGTAGSTLARAIWRMGAAAARARGRLGWRATGAGLALVAALAVWCYARLRANFQDPLAPWIWAATLAALALTFAGARPRADQPGLLPHDPAEPATEPPVSRREWLAVAAIMLVAILVRVWNLENIPVGPYTDEGDRLVDARHLNRGEPVNQAPFVFFGTGWWGVPSLYFWLVAQSLKVFGDTLAGGRMVHALAGIGTVWVAYRTARLAWSPRAGLLAGALLAVSDFAIQFSRTAGESTITLFTWAVCFYFLYKALKYNRPLDFVLSGLAGGFTLYGYVAGKLLPVFLLLLSGYLLVRWGRTGVRRYLPGLLLLALAGAITYAPNGLYALAHPDTFTVRYSGVSIFNHANEYRLAYNTDNWGVILAHQFGLTFSAFDVGQERGPFYPTGAPILPVPWAAVWVLGAAYLLWRIGDVRFAVLGVWVLSGLAGAALTNDTPTLQRVAGMVPTLAVVPAVFLDRVARGAPALRWQPALPRPRRILRLAMNLLLGLLVVSLTLQTLSFYFGPYTAAAHYYWYTIAGRYAQPLDPQHNLVYQMDAPEFYWYMGPALFLAKDVQGRDLINVQDELPLTTNADKNAHFLVFPSNAAYLPVLQTYYPGGSPHVVNRPDGSLFFTAYEVDMPQFDAQRQVTARYGPASGPLFERQEPRLGTLGDADAANALRPPDGLTYPTGATWSGGLVAPVYGTYQLSLTAPGGATLEIDGRPLLTAPPGSTAPATAVVVLARGAHAVQLAGTLPGPDSPVELRWGTPGGSLVPIARPFLWGGPLGSLLGTTYPSAAGAAWFSAPQVPAAGMAALQARRDGFLGARSINGALGGGSQVSAAWSGTFQAAVAGPYFFDAATDGKVSILIDGQVAGSHSVAGLSPSMPAQATLTTGDHTLDVRFQAQHDNTSFDLYWQPPGGARVILPPTVLRPAQGGAWPAAERPNVPAPDPSLLAAAAPLTAVRVLRQIAGAGAWQEARGVGVLPDGRVVVADSGHGRLLVYAPDGRQVATWGSPGSGDGHFGLIADVAVGPDGRVAVLDADHGDIQVLDGNGTVTAHLAQAQLGLAHSSGLAWGPDNYLYVADTANSRVVRVAPDGQGLAAFRAGDAAHRPLEQPVDVAVTADGTLYAVDLRGRLVRFSPAGQIDREWALPVGTTRGGNHLAVWGHVLAVSNPERNSLAFLDLQTGALGPLPPAAAAAIPLALPVGLAAGPDGALYVLNSGAGTVLVLGQGP